MDVVMMAGERNWLTIVDYYLYYYYHHRESNINY
jgi:hypothetical protein